LSCDGAGSFQQAQKVHLHPNNPISRLPHWDYNQANKMFQNHLYDRSGAVFRAEGGAAESVRTGCLALAAYSRFTALGAEGAARHPEEIEPADIMMMK